MLCNSLPQRVSFSQVELSVFHDSYSFYFFNKKGFLVTVLCVRVRKCTNLEVVVDFWQPLLVLRDFQRGSLLHLPLRPAPCTPWRSLTEVLARVSPALPLRSDEIGLPGLLRSRWYLLHVTGMD